MDNMLNLTGLWAHPERKDVFSAKMQMGTVWLRRNPDKQGDKDPGWWLSFSNEEKTLVNLAGLYENTAKTGIVYLSGYFGGLRVMCFFVEKKSDKHPDISLCFGERKRKQED